MTIWEISEKRITSRSATSSFRISGTSTVTLWFRDHPVKSPTASCNELRGAGDMRFVLFGHFTVFVTRRQL